MKRPIHILIMLLAVVLLPSANASCAKKDPKPLTLEEASILIKKLSPEIEVVSVEPASVEGLFETVVKFKGQIQVVYLDAAGKHIVLGNVINLDTKLNLTKLKLDDAMRVDFSKIPLEDALVMGSADAKHKVIVFDDPD